MLKESIQNCGTGGSVSFEMNDHRCEVVVPGECGCDVGESLEGGSGGSVSSGGLEVGIELLEDVHGFDVAAATLQNTLQNRLQNTLQPPLFDCSPALFLQPPTFWLQYRLHPSFQRIASGITLESFLPGSSETGNSAMRLPSGMAMNRHGLSRSIPEETKRLVRRRCGFGCVICGNAITEYDHFDPAWADATEHRQEGIVLLCPTHHTEKSRGRLSSSAVKSANDNPFCVSAGSARHDFSLYNGELRGIRVGTSMFKFKSPETTILTLGEHLVFGFSVQDGHVMFSLDLGVNSKIENNVWISDSDGWDTTLVGRTVICRSERRRVELAFNLPTDDDPVIQVNQLEFAFEGFTVELKNDKLRVCDGGVQVLELNGGEFEWGNALDLSTPTSIGRLENVEMKGGELNTASVGGLEINGGVIDGGRIVHHQLLPKGIPFTAPLRPGRNDACLCGSGRKFKKCCGAGGR
jgi:SEC-C motif